MYLVSDVLSQLLGPGAPQWEAEHRSDTDIVTLPPGDGLTLRDQAGYLTKPANGAWDDDQAQAPDVPRRGGRETRVVPG